MFYKVIWATDGSENADRALELAKSQVSGNGGSLLALHSTQYVVAKGTAPVHVDEDETMVKVKQQVADLQNAGVKAEFRAVESGSHGAAHSIARVADEEGADLIVVGTRGHTPLAGVFLGSVAQRLASISPCPVLVVPKAAD
jgi:nucleotide-binding universal stress UspA family protein